MNQRDVSPPYDVEESARFQIEIAVLAGGVHQWDDIKQAFDIYVARDPHAFEDVPGTEYKAVPLPVIPPLTVYFLIEEDRKCVILDRVYSGFQA